MAIVTSTSARTTTTSARNMLNIGLHWRIDSIWWSQSGSWLFLYVRRFFYILDSFVPSLVQFISKHSIASPDCIFTFLFCRWGNVFDEVIPEITICVPLFCFVPSFVGSKFDSMPIISPSILTDLRQLLITYTDFQVCNVTWIMSSANLKPTLHEQSSLTISTFELIFCRYLVVRM